MKSSIRPRFDMARSFQECEICTSKEGYELRQTLESDLSRREGVEFLQEQVEGLNRIVRPTQDGLKLEFSANELSLLIRIFGTYNSNALGVYTEIARIVPLPHAFNVILYNLQDDGTKEELRDPRGLDQEGLASALGFHAYKAGNELLDRYRTSQKPPALTVNAA